MYMYAQVRKEGIQKHDKGIHNLRERVRPAALAIYSPLKTWIIIVPKDKTSMVVSYFGLASITSGGMKAGVPHAVG